MIRKVSQVRRGGSGLVVPGPLFADPWFADRRVEPNRSVARGASPARRRRSDLCTSSLLTLLSTERVATTALRYAFERDEFAVASSNMNSNMNAKALDQRCSSTLSDSNSSGPCLTVTQLPWAVA